MMSDEGAPKDGIKMQARDKEDPPANDATSSPAGDNSGSDTLSEPSTMEVNHQTLESAVEENSDEAEFSEPNDTIIFDASATEVQAVVSAPSSEPSGTVAIVEKKAKHTPAVKSSLEAPKDAKDTPAGKVTAEAPKDTKDTSPLKASVEAPKEAKHTPAVKSSVEALEETEKNNKVAESSTKIVPDPTLDEASADNTTDAKDVSLQEAASVEAPKEVASVQKGGLAAETSKGVNTAAVLSTEKKTISDERNNGDPSPEKVTKPEKEPPAVGVSYNVVRVDASSEDAKMKEARDSDQEHDSTSRKKRSAAKSVGSDGTAVSKRKKIAAKSVLLGNTSATDWQMSPSLKSPIDAATKKKKADKKASPEKEAIMKKEKAEKEEKKAAKKKPKAAAKKKTAAKKAVSPKQKKKEGSANPQKGPSAIEVWTGEPNEPLEGGWPAGWTKKIFERPSGATKGSHDRYWYTPITKRKLRSMVEVKRFIAALGESKGNEDEAWKIFKNK